MAAASLLLSLCLIVKDEEKNIARCLKSARTIVDEIVLIDTGSSDQTIPIAKTFEAKIHRLPWTDDFSAARNQALRRAKGEWILSLDADEYLDKSGADRLRRTLKTAKEEGFYVLIQNYQGVDRSRVTRTYSLRLFRNHPLYRYEGKIHEQILPSIQKANPQAVLAWSPLIIHHEGYLKDAALVQEKARRNLEILRCESPDVKASAFYSLNLALEYIRLDKTEEAETELKKGWEKADRQAGYAHYLLLKLIACLHQQKKDPEAIAYCRRGLDLYPGYADILYYYGICLLKTGDSETAREALLQGLQQGESPKKYVSQAGCGSYLNLVALGEIEERDSNFEAASAYYLQAFRLQAHQLSYLKRLLRVLLKGSPDQRPYLRAYLKDNNLLGSETVLTIVQTAYTLNQYSLVLEILSEWENPDHPWELRFIEGQSLMRLGQYQEALARFAAIPQPSPLPELQKDSLVYSWLSAVLQEDFQLALYYSAKLKVHTDSLSRLLAALQNDWQDVLQTGLPDGIPINPGDSPEVFRNNESVLALLEIIDNLAACQAIKFLNPAIAFLLQITGEDFVPLLLKILDKHRCNPETLDLLKTGCKNGDEEACPPC